ncbi:hypothetical protein GCM10010466_61730 [Planomonospora alba]|uniref:Uncharacterized protein n=1 Tax=Planomonospora alba TaxID=161354 RepID=A0ABP6P128_9ACTN
MPKSPSAAVRARAATSPTVSSTVPPAVSSAALSVVSSTPRHATVPARSALTEQPAPGGAVRLAVTAPGGLDPHEQPRVAGLPCALRAAGVTPLAVALPR